MALEKKLSEVELLNNISSPDVNVICEQDGEWKKASIDIGGDKLGLVKNGGNVTINPDGTMTAPEGTGGSGDANVQSDWNESTETSDAFIKNKPPIENGEGQNSIQEEGCTAIGDYSVAFGKNSIAGCKGYYIKSIDKTNKKIYLCDEKVLPVITTKDNTDTSFETPGYESGMKFTIINGSHYIMCNSILQVSNNCVTYDDELPFTSIVEDDRIDAYSFTVPMQPKIGDVLFSSGTVSFGENNIATGKDSFVRGYNSKALAELAHAEGYQNVAMGWSSHAEGSYTNTTGSVSHAEGSWSTASGNASHAEGSKTTASSNNAHAEGAGTAAIGRASHAEGDSSQASGASSHAEGILTIASGDASHTEGNKTNATDNNAHAEGYSTTAMGLASHAEGYSSKSFYDLDFADYLNETWISKWENSKFSIAKCMASHAEGRNCMALANCSHAEGDCTIAQGYASHTEGEYTIAKGNGAHAEGNKTTASGMYSHAEGAGTAAIGRASHAEGDSSQASGASSHAEGILSKANNTAAHAEGIHTITGTNYQHVEGKYNKSSASYAHIVGNGSAADDEKRSNAYTLDWQGNAWYTGKIQSNGEDYSEFFEWLDGNPDNEDRVGLFVTLDGEKIKLANADDEVLGVISGTVAVLGGTYECEWNGKYLTDDFGRIIYDMVEEFIDVENITYQEVEKEIVDEETNETRIEIVTEKVVTTEKQSTGFWKHPRINPNYDPSQSYVNRSERPEWDAVGMLGKLYVRDNGTCEVNGYATVGENGVATKSDEKTNMRVLSRVNDNVIRVLLK